MSNALTLLVNIGTEKEERQIQRGRHFEKKIFLFILTARILLHNVVNYDWSLITSPLQLV